MVDGDKTRFQTLLATLAEVHRVEVGPPMLRAYFMALNDLTVEQFAECVYRSMREDRFFPKPAELRKHLNAKSTALSALEAWALVMKHCVGHIARKGPLDFGPLTNAAVRAIGGVDKLLTGTTTEHQNFTRPNFLRAYDELAQANQTELSGAVLIAEGAEGKPIQRIGQAASDRPRIESKPDDAVAELAGKLRVEV